MITIDKKAMQEMQDAFCWANNIYCYCVGKNMGRITKFSGTPEEEDFIEEAFTMEQQRALFHSFTDGIEENIIEFTMEQSYLLIRGVAIRGTNQEFIGAWLVFGVINSETLRYQQLDDTAIRVAELEQMGVKTTTMDQYERTVALLEVLTKHYFSERVHSTRLELSLSEVEATERQMEAMLQKNEVLTEILKNLESEEQFVELAKDIIQKTGEYLSISYGALLQIQSNDDMVKTICEWSLNEDNQVQGIGTVKKTELPFMTGRPYTISSDGMMPEHFKEFFKKNHLEAGVFLPLTISGKPEMYLIFTMTGQKRKWAIEELKFLNDVKRIMQTILVKRITKNSLASSYAALESILEHAGCGVVVLESKRREVLYQNETFRSMVTDEEERKNIEEFLFSSGDEKDTIEYYGKQQQCWYQISFASIHWVDGKKVELATVYDITEIKQYQQQIEQQANEDDLTGLLNRKRADLDVVEEIRNAVRSGGSCGVLYIDLDDFKIINDGLGYHSGDDLLQEIARTLRSVKGVEGHCYRMGGDEFMILVTNRNMEYFEGMIRQIQSIFSHPWLIGGQEYYCTMCMGVVIAPKDGVDWEVLQQRLDIALQSAKEKGKNRVEYYSQQTTTASSRRLDLEKFMRQAVEEGCKEFEVYYQPLMEATKDGARCRGAEALVRWNSSQLGFVLPMEFIPLAEYLGLIVPIGEHVLREACRRCKYWNDYGHPEYKINVNLSVVQLLQNDIVEVIASALEESGLEPSNLTVEVTEGMVIQDLDRMKRILLEIKEMGVRIALDDFGTGYSSLNHIRSMPIDDIKIDRCFVTGVGIDAFSDAFVKSISELAKALTLNVCVEGVEQETQKSRLHDLDVSMIQGFYFDKPMASRDFEEKYLPFT